MVDVEMTERTSETNFKDRTPGFLWAIVSDIERMLQEVGIEGIRIELEDNKSSFKLKVINGGEKE